MSRPSSGETTGSTGGPSTLRRTIFSRSGPRNTSTRPRSTVYTGRARRSVIRKAAGRIDLWSTARLSKPSRGALISDLRSRVGAPVGARGGRSRGVAHATAPVAVAPHRRRIATRRAVNWSAAIEIGSASGDKQIRGVPIRAGRSHHRWRRSPRAPTGSPTSLARAATFGAGPCRRPPAPSASARLSPVASRNACFEDLAPHQAGHVATWLSIELIAGGSSDSQVA